MKSNFTTLFHSFLLPSLPFYSFPLLPFFQTKHGLDFLWAPLTNLPNIGKLSMFEHPNYAQNRPNFHPQSGEEFKTSYSDSPNPASLNVPQKGHAMPGGQATVIL